MRANFPTGILAAISLAAVAFAAGYATRAWIHPVTNEFALVDEAQGLLKAHYLRSLPGPLGRQRGMIRGLLGSLNDPYTIYVEPAGHELETDTLAGEYGGIGASLFLDTQGSIRLVPTSGGPADDAGVLEGDVLEAVDGKAVEAIGTMDDVTAAIRGPAGTQVTLTLAPRSIGAAPLELEIVRAVIELPSSTGYLLPEDENVGVIVVSVFSEKTSEEIQRAYDDLSGRGALSLILDLRGNGGGLLDSAVSVSRLFLSSGVIAVEHRKDQTERHYSAQAPGPLSEVPLAVLIDGGTASAAEVVAAALQENGRAPLIGSPTFGKGSVQVILPLSDGSSLHVTSAEWFTPRAETLDGVGLQPDIRAERAEDGSDNALAAARTWLTEHGGRK